MHIGQHGLYRTPEGHHGITKKAEEELHGSVHHPEMRLFFAIVGRVHPAHETEKERVKERVDVALIVPDRRELVWVHGVHEGTGHGEFEPDGHKPKARNAKAEG